MNKKGKKPKAQQNKKGVIQARGTRESREHKHVRHARHVSHTRHTKNNIPKSQGHVKHERLKSPVLYNIKFEGT